jgi:hypothetical protein
MFICKIFDSVTKPTVQLIYILSRYYDKVFLMKPRTSRYSNSEKYIVCTGFRGISQEELSELDKILNSFKNGNFCRDLFYEDPEITLERTTKGPSDEFYKNIYNYNYKIIKNQIKYINESIKLSNSNNNNSIKIIEAYQNKRAMEFCDAFGIEGFSSKLYENCRHYSKLLDRKGPIRCEKCLRLFI